MTAELPKPTTFQAAWDLLPQPRANRILKDAAARISAECHRILEPADLGQEFMLFLAAKPYWATKWHYESEGKVLFGWKSFTRDAAAVMAKAVKAERCRTGYSPEDESLYTPKQLESLLPFVFHTQVLATVGEESEERRAPVDASKGGGHMAAVMDVRLAYDRVIAPCGLEDQVLNALYFAGLNQAEAAIGLDVTQQVVSRHKRKAFDALLHHLNGTEAIRQEHDGPGARRVRSNGSAIAATRSQE